MIKTIDKEPADASRTFYLTSSACEDGVKLAVIFFFNKMDHA